MTEHDQNEPGTEVRRPGRGPGNPLRKRAAPAKPAARFDPGRVAEPRHRNPTWLVAGILLVVLSALGGVLLFSSTDDRTEVVVAAADLVPGQPIDRSDLRIARVAVDGDVATISPDAAADIVGQQPVGQVPAGTLLSPGMFADEIPLGSDEMVVGAALDPGEAPLSALEIGAAVELLAVQPGDPNEPEPAVDSAGGAAAATPIGTGTIWAVEAIATGQTWISMRVSRDVGLAASLASAQDALRIVLVGDPG